MAEVEYERDGHVARVRLNRPARLNAMTAAMDTALAEIWRAVEDDPEVRVVVLSGAGGRAFCAGADLGDLDARGRSGIAFGGGLTGIGGPLVTLGKPLIAAVHGHALGGGCELALCADLVIAGASATFGLPETRIGVIDGAGVVHRVVRQLPYRRAMAMILTGEPLTAAEALAHGLINEVVDDAGVLEAADRWAAKVASVSPLAAQAAKQAAVSRLGHPLEVALTTRYDAIERYGTSADRAEAQRAFAERRTASWTGR